MEAELICIVEGHGDFLSVPILVRRIAFEIDTSLSVRCRCWRIPKGALIKSGGLEREVETAARRYPDARGLLVLLDSDRDCPATTGPELLGRSLATRPHLPTTVILAKREYEAWFIAAIHSVSQHRDFLSPLSPPPEPEEIVGAKEWLTKRMRPGIAYSETRHQPAFTSMMDFAQAKTSQAFRKLLRDMPRVLSLSA